jgi:hypothetical protein
MWVELNQSECHYIVTTLEDSLYGCVFQQTRDDIRSLIEKIQPGILSKEYAQCGSTSA